MHKKTEPNRPNTDCPSYNATQPVTSSNAMRRLWCFNTSSASPFPSIKPTKPSAPDLYPMSSAASFSKTGS